MQQIACPGCGAPVQFKSAASVLAVCSYCQTTVMKDAESVRDLGKMGSLIEDFSPFQIGSSGIYLQRPFTLIGRLQLRYDDGLWNEWYILFDDGEGGWLSDASGQYTVTLEKALPPNLPPFSALTPGQSLTLGGLVYTAADVRSARCTAGQGELPFRVGSGYTVRAADFRHVDDFVTLDYSEEPPRAYLGRAVHLAQLQCGNLRDTDALIDSAGRGGGKLSALACPHCGHAVKVTPGLTVVMICPACHSSIDIAEPAAAVLAIGQQVAAIPLSLELGAVGHIDGGAYTVMGALKRRSINDNSGWTEYLLWDAKRGFLWLIETDSGWQRAEVEDHWPVLRDARSVVSDPTVFQLREDYMARVDAAIGAFNWRVAVGDTVRVMEFEAGQERLAGEISSTEMTWTRSRRVALDQVRAWFGAHVHAELAPHPDRLSSAKTFLIALVALNFIPVLFGGGGPLIICLIAALLIWVPAKLLEQMEGGGA